MASISVRGTKWQVKIRRKGQPHLSATFATEQEARLWIAENEQAATGPTVGDLFRK
ncbi:hypothetical protein [Paraburkholderia caledonica]|uniref:hypothetical protein n=1 Tax=Paraburkholderia caledonica TaxID=134536 RepID=UPI0018787420